MEPWLVQNNIDQADFELMETHLSLPPWILPGVNVHTTTKPGP